MERQARREGEGEGGGGSGSATPWEYKFVSMGNPLEEGVEERANAFGKRGWELVLIEAGVWIFKRPLTGEVEAEEPLKAIIEQTVPIAEVAPAPAVAPGAGAGPIVTVIE